MLSSGHTETGEVYGISLADAGAGKSTLVLHGDWTLVRGMPDPSDILSQLKQRRATRITIDSENLVRWDDALVSYLMQLKERGDKEGLRVDISRIPEGARRLVNLALAVPERLGASRHVRNLPFYDAVGQAVLTQFVNVRDLVTFLGEVALMFARYFAGRAIYQRRDLWQMMQECGADALPIVTIISLLVGMILGFVGAVQLKQFGAGVYIADLVGIAMLREMGAVMTGIVLAGRTGAAYAAQIGTMQGNEEVDSLITLGIPPLDFLVLPRMLALILMMPLLTIYADLVGIIGGWMVGASILDLSPIVYYEQTQRAVDNVDFFFGIFKGGVFGAVIATAGCYRGLRCGRSAAAVGTATTSAVVTGILYIIALDGVFAVVTTVLGI